MTLEVNIFYLLLPLIILGWVAWKNTPNAVAVIVLLAPSYLIKSNIVFIPTTFLELSIYTVILIILIKYFCLKDNQITNPFPIAGHFNWIILAWLLSAVVAVLASNDLRLSLGVLKGWWIDPIIFFYLLLATIKTSAHWLKVLNAFWGSASLLAAYGLIEYGFGWGLQTDGLLNSVYNPANYLAMYLVPAIFVGGALTWIFWKTPIGKLNLFILAVDLWVLFLTKSYGGFLALAVGSAVFIWLALSGRVQLRRQITFIFIGILIVGGFIVVQQPKFQGFIQGESRTSLSTRQEIWRTSWLLIKEKPIMGWGLGNFQESYRSHTKYITLTPLEWYVVKAHNIFLNLWVEVGLLGLLVFIYWVGKYLWHLISVLKSEIYFRKLWGSVLVAMMVATLAHGLVDTPYFKNDLSVVFFLVIGAGLLLNYYKEWRLEIGSG